MKIVNIPKDRYDIWSTRDRFKTYASLMESINSKIITHYFKGWIHSPITPSIAVIIGIEMKMSINKGIMKRLSNKAILKQHDQSFESTSNRI